MLVSDNRLVVGKFAGVDAYSDVRARGRGGGWDLGRHPGISEGKFGSHEVINTIMLNFIAIALVGYFTQYFFKIPGDPIMQTANIGEAADIPRLNQFLPFIPADVPLNVAFLLAI